MEKLYSFQSNYYLRNLYQGEIYGNKKDYFKTLSIYLKIKRELTITHQSFEFPG